jgi:hypothetical protein
MRIPCDLAKGHRSLEGRMEKLSRRCGVLKYRMKLND